MKKPSHLSKWVHIFIIYTIITLVIGLAIKGVLIGRLINRHSVYSDAHDALLDIKSNFKGKPMNFPFPTTIATKLSEQFHKPIKVLGDVYKLDDDMQRYIKIEVTGLILQSAIVLLTIVVYSRSLYDMRKLWTRPDNKYTKKNYRTFKIEYIIFLAIFLIIDAYATYIIFKEKPKMDFWLIYTITSLIIPTLLAIGSLVILRMTKSDITPDTNDKELNKEEEDAKKTKQKVSNTNKQKST